MSSTREESLFPLVRTMKRAAAALDDAGVPALLAGGMAAWARGGPPTDHDVDFFVRELDAQRALAALVEAGMREEQPPEGWLLKAYDGPVLVDLIFHPSGQVVDDAMFSRADLLEVKGLLLHVASVDDVLITKLLSLTEQEPDFGPVLAIARALREQIDWERVERQTFSSPFARAFFTLVEGLEILRDSPSEHCAVRPTAHRRGIAERLRRRSQGVNSPPRTPRATA
jgi:hypothetical protein